MMRNMKFYKKHHMTLIEILVASFLTMILLTAMFSFYRQIIMIDKEAEKLQKEHFKLAYLEKKLNSAIPNIISPTDAGKDFYFFTSNNATESNLLSLVFTFDNKVNLKSNHSNHLLARLFVDDKQNLCLATWGTPKYWDINPNPEITKEILLENVISLDFEFYVPQKKDRAGIVSKIQQAIDIQPEDSWHKSWSYKTQELPAMIKIHLIKKIDEKQYPVSFAFFLPNSNLSIMYDN